jgi:hypothetical protein
VKHVAGKLRQHERQELFRFQCSADRLAHRDRPTAFAIFSNHPTVAPHVHSLLVVHPGLTDRFLTIAGNKP